MYEQAIKYVRLSKRELDAACMALKLMSTDSEILSLLGEKYGKTEEGARYILTKAFIKFQDFRDCDSPHIFLVESQSKHSL